jgi:hypothetical protein
MSTAQNADFIVLKHKGKTKQSFFAGRNIELTTSSGAYINALINGIKNDTLYLQEFIVQTLPTTIGTYIRDTLGSYHHKFHYNQIAVIGKKEKRGFSLRASGASLFGGGLLLTVGSGIVYLVNRKNFSPRLMAAGAALGAVGYILLKTTSSNSYVIGKKYTLQYINMTNSVQ